MSVDSFTSPAEAYLNAMEKERAKLASYAPAVPASPIAYSFADTQFEVIQRYILDFQSSLDQNHDVGMLLTNFGQSLLMEVTEIGYEQPVLMIFQGFVNGRSATLIQHISQLSFLLTSVSKDPDVPKRKIGFTSR